MQPIEYTARGFGIVKFEDYNGVECTLQESSLATEEAIWLGAKEIGLKHFKAYQGWKDIDTPHSTIEHWSANTRMHLTREQVRDLLPFLIKFVDSGQLSE